MKKLEAGSGPLGLGRINLEQQKREVCNLQYERPVDGSKNMLHKLAMDGIYVDDPEVHSKFTDINVQKLEERLLNSG